MLHHLLVGHREAGNHIIGVVGARQRDLLILKDEMRALCDELIVTTDDGSYGMHGRVTDALAAWWSGTSTSTRCSPSVLSS